MGVSHQSCLQSTTTLSRKMTWSCPSCILLHVHLCSCWRQSDVIQCIDATVLRMTCLPPPHCPFSPKCSPPSHRVAIPMGKKRKEHQDDAVGLFCDCKEHCGGVRRPLGPTAYCEHTKYHTSPLMKTIKKFLGRASELREPGTSSNASGSAADANRRRVEVHVSAYNHSTHELTCPVAAGYRSWAVLRIWMSTLCEPQGYSNHQTLCETRHCRSAHSSHLGHRPMRILSHSMVMTRMTILPARMKRIPICKTI